MSDVISAYSVRGTLPPPIWWPAKYPNEVRQHTYDVSLQTTNYADIYRIDVQVSPSGVDQLEGTIELTATSVIYVGSLVTVTFQDGQAGQLYRVLFTAYLSNSERIQWEIGLQVLGYFDGIEESIPSVDDFGSPVSWSSAAVFALNGNFVVFDTNVSFPTSAPSWSGAAWDNGGFLSGVPGITPNPTAPSQFFESINPSFFLWYGVGSLPIVDPHVLDQLWLNGGFVCRSAG